MASVGEQSGLRTANMSVRWRAAPIVPAALAVALIETLLLIACAYARLPTFALVAGHVLVMAALLALVRREHHRGRDLGAWLLLVVAVAAIGPLGAIGGLIVGLFDRDVSPTARRRLDDWYQRIALSTETDDVSRLCDKVSIGRTMDFSSAAPRAFSAIMERGQLADQQAVLGHIARHFHPDYLACLTLALKNPEPVVRVQAAAVATRVRADLKARLARAQALADKGSAKPEILLATAHELEQIGHSGLLDASEMDTAAAVADRLKAAGGGAVETVASRLLEGAGTASREIEQQLLDQGRFRDLRRLRRIAAVRRRGSYRVRALPRRRSAGQRRRIVAGETSRS